MSDMCAGGGVRMVRFRSLACDDRYNAVMVWWQGHLNTCQALLSIAILAAKGTRGLQEHAGKVAQQCHET